MGIYLRFFSHPRYHKWNQFLLNLAYQGLGINQWRNLHVSGEKYFLDKILPKSSRVIFDVGAYHGSYSKTARFFHPDAEIYAFEPHPKSFLSLEKAALSSNFHAYPIGLGPSCCSTKLYDDVNRQGSAQASFLEQAFTQYNVPTACYEVNVKTLDDFCKEQVIEHIDLLKIDAEGFEYDILKGALRMIGSLSIDVIQFELNQLSLISKKSFFDFMELLPEYTFYRLLYRGMVPLTKQNAHALSEHQNIIAWSPCAHQTFGN